MTSDRDIERILDHWLTERPTQVADRVLDEVADRIARHPQQPAWRVSWRDIHVQTYLKPLLAVAAVIVIVVGGLAVLRPSSGSDVGGAVTPSATPPATPSPVPSTSPSAAPSAGAVLPPWYRLDEPLTGAGILPAGRHSTESFRPGFTFRVPEGWVNDTDVTDYFTLFPDTPANEAEFARSGALAQGFIMGLRSDPWFICEPFGHTVGATADEVVASLSANEALADPEPVDIAIGGLTGKQVTVQLDPDWTGSCPPDPENPTLDVEALQQRALLLDGPRGLIVFFLGSLHSDGHEAFLAEAMPIIESFEFDLTP
jgi:hypothetical protein